MITKETLFKWKQEAEKHGYEGIHPDRMIALIDAIVYMDKELKLAREHLLEMCDQHCPDDYLTEKRADNVDYYDSRCLSANESALAYLVRSGVLQKEQVTR